MSEFYETGSDPEIDRIKKTRDDQLNSLLNVSAPTEKVIKIVTDKEFRFDSMPIGDKPKNTIIEGNTCTPPLTKDDESGLPIKENCAMYEMDIMAECTKKYSKITHSIHIDDVCREIHHFDDGHTTPLVVVVFRNARRRLVSVNEYVLPMSEFININEMVFIKNDKKEEASHQLRAPFPIDTGFVRALTETHNYAFADTTVPLLMMAVAYFADKYFE
jgi:hypothetical protein